MTAPTETRPPRSVAVLGAGVMGHGIALLHALAGYRVGLHDTRPDALEAGVRRIEQSLAFLAAEALAPRDAVAAAAGRIVATDDLARAVEDAEVVTEAVPEVLDVKLELFARLEALLPPDALILSNTSTFPITALAQRARRPERFLTTHYFNPAQLVPLVEVLPHPRTPPATVDGVLELLRRLGKRPVLLRREVPGFVANRLQAALAREAFHLLEEGVVTADDLDAVVTEGPGVRWPFLGPLAVAELGGLDTWQRVLDNLAPHLSTARAAPRVVAQAVARGDLGAKTGRGLRSYAPGEVERRTRERDRSLAALLRLKRG